MDVYKRLSAPLSAQIEITGLCNHSCQHCYNFWRAGPSLKPKNVSLSETDAISIVKKLANAGVFRLTVTGGEPLLNLKVCLACVETAKSMGMGVGINSNLTLLTPNIARNLRKVGIDHILTSILGPTPEIHDEITQKKGSFKKLLKGIKVAHESGIMVCANMVVSQINFKVVRATAEIVKKLGVDRFSATKASCPGNCSDFSRLALSSEQLVQLLNKLSWIKRNLDIRVDSLGPIPYCGMIGVENPEDFISRRCYAGLATMTISYNGSVRPCAHLDYEYGNLLTKDFTDIWLEMSPLWSQGLHIPDDCKECPVFASCNGGCRMEAKMRGGGIGAMDPYAKKSNRKAAEAIYYQCLQEQPPTPPLPKKIRTALFRMRKEVFGGVVIRDDDDKPIFLNRDATTIINQLKPNTVYNFPINIDWKGIDSSTFIAGLIQGKIFERR